MLENLEEEELRLKLYQLQHFTKLKSTTKNIIKKAGGGVAICSIRR